MNDTLDEDFLEKEYLFEFKIWPIVIWGILLLIGILFYIMHWPGSSIIILTPTGILTAYAISGFIRFKGKNILNNTLCIFATAYFIFIITGLVFNDGYPFNLYGISIYSGILVSSFIFL